MLRPKETSHTVGTGVATVRTDRCSNIEGVFDEDVERLRGGEPDSAPCSCTGKCVFGVGDPFCFDYIVVGKNKFRRQSRHEPIVAMSVLYRLVICSPSRFTGSVRLPVS